MIHNGRLRPHQTCISGFCIAPFIDTFVLADLGKMLLRNGVSTCLQGSARLGLLLVLLGPEVNKEHNIGMTRSQPVENLRQSMMYFLFGIHI